MAGHNRSYGRRRLTAAVDNIDVAPTIARILGVKPDNTVQGHALDNYFKKGQ